VLPANQIFKKSPRGNPLPMYSDHVGRYLTYGKGVLNIDQKSGVLRDFLDGAARISSAADYLKSDSKRQLFILQEYLLKILPFQMGANVAESAGIRDYHQLLCLGGGVCRHQADLLAQIYAEAGFRSRFASVRPTGSSPAHIWLELDVQEGYQSKTYIADPALGTLKSLEEAIEQAKRDPESPDATRWANPKRVTRLAN
jgi:hypothetical protein